MKPVRKFLGLPPARRRLVVESVVVLGMIRLGLWLLPFHMLRRCVAGLAGTRRERAPVGQVVWAVGVASRYVPQATCLAQALAGQVLLARYGYPPSLRLGVTKDQGGRLQAHAWVESQGRVVIGNVRDLSRFTPLPPLEGERL